MPCCFVGPARSTSTAAPRFSSARRIRCTRSALPRAFLAPPRRRLRWRHLPCASGWRLAVPSTTVPRGATPPDFRTPSPGRARNSRSPVHCTLTTTSSRSTSYLNPAAVRQEASCGPTRYCARCRIVGHSPTVTWCAVVATTQASTLSDRRLRPVDHPYSHMVRRNGRGCAIPAA